MRFPRFRYTLAMLLIWLQALSTLSAQTVGTHGARFDFEGKWKQISISPDLGEDQFLGQGEANNCFLVVLEGSGIFLKRADFQVTLNTMLQTMEDDMGNPVVGKESFRQAEDFLHISRNLSGELEGTKLYYQLDIIGRDGLAYTLLSWSPNSLRKRLQSNVKDLIRTFKMPDPSSSWGMSAKANQFTHRLKSECEVSFRAQSSIFQPDSAVEADLALCDYLESAYIYVWEIEARDLISAEKKILGNMNAEPDKVKARMGLRIDQFYGSKRTIQFDNTNLTSVVLELAPGKYLDFRAGWDGPAGLHDDLIQPIVDSIRLRKIKFISPIPEPAKTATTEYSAAVNDMIQAAKSHGEIAYGIRYALRCEKGLLFTTGKEVFLLETGQAEPKLLYEGKWSSSYSIAWRQQRLWIKDRSGDLFEVVDGIATPARDFRGSLLPLEDGGWLTCPEASDPVIGLEPRLSQSFGAGFLRLWPSGKRRLYEITEFQVNAFHTAGKSVLVVAGNSTEGRQTLYRYDPGSHVIEKLSQWRTIDCIGPAPDGWLITGRPVELQTGVYLQPRTGSPKLLVGGKGFVGLEIDSKNNFWFSTSIGMPAQSKNLTHLKSLSLLRTRTLGPRCQPWSGILIDQLAISSAAALQAELLPEILFADASSIRAFTETARSLAAEQKRSLPETATQLDYLIADLRSGGDISGASGLLLTALIVDQLLKDGATWIASNGPKKFQFPRRPIRANPIAIGYRPLQWLESFDLDNFYSQYPCTWFQSLSNGRKVYLGLQHEEIQAAVDAANIDVSASHSWSIDQIVQLAKNHPANVSLRSTFYQSLGRQNRLDEAVHLAKEFLKPPHSAAEDWQAYLGAKYALGDPILIQCKRAISIYPDSEILLLLLAHAYRDAEEWESARYCYQKLASDAYGNSRNLAELALLELKNK